MRPALVLGGVFLLVVGLGIAVKGLVDVYAKHARPFERMGEWIERIGWPRFFKLTGIEFTKYHIDDFRHAGESYRRSAHIRQSPA